LSGSLLVVYPTHKTSPGDYKLVIGGPSSPPLELVIFVKKDPDYDPNEPEDTVT
jgi:hypothetical protein